MSFVQVRPSSGGGTQSLVAERTPFFGARVPEEVKLMYKALKSADEGTVKKIFKCTLESCLIANIETILMSLFFSKCYLYTTLLFFSLTLSIFLFFLPLPSVVVQSLESSSSDVTLSQSFLSLSSSKSSEETNRIIFSGLLLLIKTALRQPNLKPEVIIISYISVCTHVPTHCNFKKTCT